MKISLDIDCTPEEARRFLGLPDVSALNERLMEQLAARLESGLDPAELDRLLQGWMPAAASGAMGDWQQWQKAFWEALAGEKSGGAEESS